VGTQRAITTQHQPLYLCPHGSTRLLIGVSSIPPDRASAGSMAADESRPGRFRLLLHYASISVLHARGAPRRYYRRRRRIAARRPDQIQPRRHHGPEPCGTRSGVMQLLRDGSPSVFPTAELARSGKTDSTLRNHTPSSVAI